ncbi:hypothetical protein [Flavobacterium sp.]|uniref:hypothetical protein n=1 Tax=Flavobacterium sp. TaxID=239 RepID=UPI0012119431|nr:hypothetical protein [Flavobacterium sp.]RZJ72215.1 MAG: hypothetical protein EOO49_07110 [Flavobacterium sp.]
MNAFNLGNEPKFKSGFKSPDGYFDNLEDAILAKLPVNEPKVVSLFARHRTTFYAAAAILVLALMIPVYQLLEKPSENIDQATLENYLAYESGLNQFDLVNELGTEDIEHLQQQTELPVSDEAIEAVLSDNNIEHIITE